MAGKSVQFAADKTRKGQFLRKKRKESGRRISLSFVAVGKKLLSRKKLGKKTTVIYTRPTLKCEKLFADKTEIPVKLVKQAAGPYRIGPILLLQLKGDLATAARLFPVLNETPI